MNLRSPQETRSSLTPSLIYRSYSKHPLLLFKLWAFFSLFLNRSLSLLFVADTDLYRSKALAINFTPFCFRRDGTWRGYCTPGWRRVGGGWRRTARLIPFFTRRCFRFSTFIVKSRLVCWTVASLAQIYYNFVCCFPYSRCIRPSCAVTWRLSSKYNIKKIGLHTQTGYGVGEDESHGGGEGICGEDPGSYVQVLAFFVILICAFKWSALKTWLFSCWI